MRKNVLALSITAAVAALGFAGSAQAIGLAQPAGVNPIPPGVATTLRTSVDGVGHFLYVPYYSVQSGNNTMINLVNTDTLNGKAVKVRFRGAANSDDVYDFQVFLSPGDVWTASVSQNAAGLAQLNTQDTSCTKPAKATLNATPFSTIRLDDKRTGDALANETREGYVEIFNMANIPPTVGGVTNPLYTAIKHVQTVTPPTPPCTGTAWTALETDALDLAAANAKGLTVPTTGLMANWIILNVGDAGAWTGQATAIYASDAAGAATTGALTYFPQTNEALGVDAARLALFSADPVLKANPTMAAVYDLPDFSIPYTTATDPAQQVALLSSAISTRSIANEFLTNSAINATTDWVLSMPTRRYSVAMDYVAGTRVYTALATPFFDANNTTVVDRQVCVTGTTSTSFNQEETSPTTPGAGVIVSPQVPGKPTSFLLCGEASVLSFNAGETASASGLIKSASGTLRATVARSAIENGYVAGWSYLATPGLGAGLGNGLPVLGYEAIRATAGAKTFGGAVGHRTSRTRP